MQFQIAQLRNVKTSTYLNIKFKFWRYSIKNMMEA
jgi:hypothetical protein